MSAVPAAVSTDDGSRGDRSQHENGTPGARKKCRRKLPLEMRSLISGKLNSGGSDSEDDVDRLVATVRLQRKRVGRLRTILAVCIAAPVFMTLGGLVAGHSMIQQKYGAGLKPSQLGGQAVADATEQCAEAARPQFQASAITCHDAGGFCAHRNCR